MLPFVFGILIYLFVIGQTIIVQINLLPALFGPPVWNEHHGVGRVVAEWVTD